MTRVVIAGGGTGGHLMPALAIAEALRALDAAIEPVLVGARRGIEARLLPARAYRHYLLPAEPIHRRAWWRNARWPVVAPRLLVAADRVLAAERPAVLVGTGGYAAGPVLFRAWRRGIPIVLQEQNALPGLTTRLFARVARQVHLGYPEARAWLRPGPECEVVESGNPIVPPPVPRPGKGRARVALGVEPDRPVVFVFGGSQGAVGLNEAVAALVEGDGLGEVALLWSTGAHGWSRFGRYDAPPRRLVRPFWDPIAEAYAASDLVVCRSGAMTTAELCAWGLPAVLVPLPTAAADHQTHNARALQEGGAAVLLRESELTAERLRETVTRLISDPSGLARMGRSGALRGYPKSAETIARSIHALVS